MINKIEYVAAISAEAILEHGVYGSLALKLVADLDAADITQDEANAFIMEFESIENVDLIEFM